MEPTRRVAQLSRHITAGLTAAGTVGEEVRQILEALGPDPLVTMSKKMVYKFKTSEIPPLADRGYKNLPAVVAKIQNLCPSTEEVPSMGPETDALQVAKALLLYAADALDEAHLTSLRLSMSKKYANSEAHADANYTHALLHRQEGDILGPEGIDDENPEGLSGWKNSVGWFGRTKEAAKGDHPLYPTVLAAVRKIVKTTKMGTVGSEKVNSILLSDNGPAWDPDAFVEFCQEATKAKDPESLEFARQVVNTEWKILLDYVLAKAKVEVPQTANASA